MTGNLFHKAIIGTMPYLPRGLVWRFSRRYIAGTSLVDAYRAVQALNDAGCTGTIDVLGEDITNADQVADADREGGLTAFRAINHGTDALAVEGMDAAVDRALAVRHRRPGHVV